MNAKINIRVNKKIKEQARKKFEDAGLDLSAGINCYLCEVAKAKKPRFGMRTENGFTPEQEALMVRETKRALKHGKSFKNAKELFDNILK